MSPPKIKIELDGRADQRMVLTGEEVRIDATDPKVVQLTVETRGTTEVSVHHSGVDVSVGRATDNANQIRVTVIDANGKVSSLEFDASAIP